jgi:DNA polymerase III epsilon subunit-like protein
MSKARYIAFDCETGGKTVETSLLTVYFGILDEDFNLIDELYLYLKPNNGAPFVVEGEGLGVNRINLTEHEKIAITLSEGGQQLVALLRKHNPDYENKLTPIGHNVSFDLGHIWAHLLKRSTWEQFVSYRPLCTAVIARFCRLAGIIPDSTSGSLTKLAEGLGVQWEGTGAHDAKSDVLATVGVLKKMIERADPDWS